MNNILFDYTYEAPPTEEERNFGWRPEGQEVRAIVLHATHSNESRSYELLTRPRWVSANAMVNEKGEAYELVSTDVQCVKKCKNNAIVHCDTKMEEEAIM